MSDKKNKFYNCEDCGLEENCREKIDELESMKGVWKDWHNSVEGDQNKFEKQLKELEKKIDKYGADDSMNYTCWVERIEKLEKADDYNKTWQESVEKDIISIQAIKKELSELEKFKTDMETGERILVEDLHKAKKKIKDINFLQKWGSDLNTTALGRILQSTILMCYTHKKELSELKEKLDMVLEQEEHIQTLEGHVSDCQEQIEKLEKKLNPLDNWRKDFIVKNNKRIEKLETEIHNRQHNFINLRKVLQEDYQFKIDRLPENELKSHYEKLVKTLSGEKDK